MSELSRQRCRNHYQREAVARCPLCKSHFCRECVTEHDDRVVCASCLAKELANDDRAIKKMFGMRRIIATGVGLFLLWGIFYYFGRALLLLPTSFHDGTFWSALLKG